MEPIKVGNVIILNHDLYWHYKQILPKYQDMISRGFGIPKEILDTPFAKSCKNLEVQSSFDYYNDIIAAVKKFEDTYPIKAENWKQ